MINKDNFNEEGDRAPNFILTDQNEEQFELYTTMSGGPIVLVILPHRNLEDQELIKLFKKSYSKYKKYCCKISYRWYKQSIIKC